MLYEVITTVTVGFGIAPNQPKRLADYTAGKEFHLAPKTYSNFPKHYNITIWNVQLFRQQKLLLLLFCSPADFR